ncbi:AAA family ATPase, partial [Candidatus Babeliales bacterium]|nr:AAA family ATPase [Candidatus Babeliales bacterium]
MSTKKMTPDQIKEESLKWQALKNEVAKTVVGQEKIVTQILIGLLCNGHILLEGVPGIAKTTLVKAVADAIGLSFSRIQFTPDLLPSDVIGTLVYNPKTHEFETRKGPIFAGLVLADEINRAPAKVQSALLEAMQEHQVTIGNNTYKIDDPFLVLATQNPIDQEGTYHLPEAQVDRFIFKLLMTYPTPKEEREIINKVFAPEETHRVLTIKDIIEGQETISQVYIDEKIIDYLLKIVSATRTPSKNLKEIMPLIRFGASPRATLALYHASKAHAFLHKRHFV